MGIFLEAMDLTIVKLVQPNQNTPNMALHRDAFSLALLAARALVSFAFGSLELSEIQGDK